MSAINPAWPIFGNPTTQSVRENFGAAKAEIDALEANKANRTELAAYLPLAGGIMSGPLALAGDPADAMQAATRRYVDTAPFLPLIGGALSGPLLLAGDPQQAAGAATRRYVDDGILALDARFLPLAGGIINGPLLLATEPTEPRGAATKHYVDETISGVAGITEAPVDGFTYGRNNRSWRRVNLPAGAMVDWASSRIPAGWLACDGQAVSRVTFAELFEAIGTEWGAGDGESTFNVPDFRGRSAVGLDTDNGSGYAQRVTLGVSGIDATQVGAVGGNEHLHAHAHAVADPGHAHGVHDPTHAHGIADPAHNHGFPDPGHAHGVSDPTHAHAIGDPGHAHGHLHGFIANGPHFMGGEHWTVGQEGRATDVAGTGIWIGGAFTGIGIYGSGTGRWIDAAGTGIGIWGAATGVQIYPVVTGIGIHIAGAGASQNMPPTAVCPKIIYAGV